MEKIAIVTATRAEYSLLTPLIRKVDEDKELDLDLIVTGTHLSDKYGFTLEAILKDRFTVAHEISILEEDNTPYGISMTVANAIKGFSDCFRDDRPDMVIVLGDRTEMLGVAIAAMNERIPIAHIHGGEVTEGAVDDSIRHALSKMSYLHFTSTEVYRKRVIQMGENPRRVFNVGALGAENILHQKLLDEKDFRKQLDIPLDIAYAVVTYHPTTLEDNTVRSQTTELCGAMEAREDVYYLITAANADAGGEEINRLLAEYVKGHRNTKFVYSLGMKRYLSAMKYAAFILGNSSSGILEAPVLGVPTVNIGDRQKGRLMPESVISCKPVKDNILEAIKQALKMKHCPTNIYGEGNASEKIIKTIKKYLQDNKINLKKGFYDIPVKI